MIPIWTVLLRGRSTSHREILTWRLSSFVIMPLVVLGALTTYNGAFDSSKERFVRMRIEEVTKDSDDDKYHARATDAEGDTHSYAFYGAPLVGHSVQVGWRDGALGWTWESSDATVVETQKP
jgi:hypothetical protein